MPDELLGPLFDDLGLHQRPEGSHDAAKEMAATSQVAPRKLLFTFLRKASYSLTHGGNSHSKGTCFMFLAGTICPITL